MGSDDSVVNTDREQSVTNLGTIDNGSGEAAAAVAALPLQVLDSLTGTIVAIDSDGSILIANSAAEQLFDRSAASLIGKQLAKLVPKSHELFSLIDRAVNQAVSVTEEGINFDTPHFVAQNVTVSVSPLYAGEGMSRATPGAVISLQTKTFAERIDKLRIPKQAVESISTMAAMLAHEIKNPLASIRGAAQLMQASLPPEELPLTELICDETDRIVGIVDRMDLFREREPIEYSAVNIHSVLDRVKTLAKTGFGKGVSFRESYDPSLPAVWGHHDLLIQALLNLVKNAAESLSGEGGEISLSTRYWHGVSVRSGNGDGERSVDVPLEITIRDNGSGIPKRIQHRLFEPFVSSKATGTGLGLALVAKVVNDHSGVIEFRSEPGRTEFLIRLPTLKTVMPSELASELTGDAASQPGTSNPPQSNIGFDEDPPVQGAD